MRMLRTVTRHSEPWRFADHKERGGSVVTCKPTDRFAGACNFFFGGRITPQTPRLGKIDRTPGKHEQLMSSWEASTTPSLSNKAHTLDGRHAAYRLLVSFRCRNQRRSPAASNQLATFIPVSGRRPTLRNTTMQQWSFFAFR